jgi:CTP:molybdopterin cytidylyltransferase MocA
MRVMTKAVFPVAGLGSRFLPATKASPKEMMPIVDKPLIQYAVEEAVAAGLTEMIFITGRHKRAIEDHFDKAYEIETELASRGKSEMLEIVRSVLPRGVNCIYIRQPEQLGLGHAVLCAQPVINDEPFAVILADDLIDGDPPVVRQMTEVFAREGRSVLGVQEVPRSQTASYGIVRSTRVDERLESVEGIVEKPRPLRSHAADLPSPEEREAGSGRGDPADRRNRVAARRGARPRLSLPRHPLRLRIEARVPAGDSGARPQAPGSRQGVQRLARLRKRVSARAVSACGAFRYILGALAIANILEAPWPTSS